MHANHREPRDVAYAGDIIALVGLKQTTTAIPSATCTTR